MITIPFSILPPKAIRIVAKLFTKISAVLSHFLPSLGLDLNRARINIDVKIYISYCMASTFVSFLILTGFFYVILDAIKKSHWSIPIVLTISLLIFYMQMNYPKIIAKKRIRNLDTDLLAALRTMVIQLNSGLNLYDAMLTVSKQEFGEVSKELGIAVKEIGAGVSAKRALEMMSIRNPSPYFRRSVWQIVNGLQAGSNIAHVMDSVIDNLSKEQVIQIEKYGGQLNPIIMFYMMTVVIIPALAITFMIVISSFLGLSDLGVKLLFASLLSVVLFFQIMFAGIVKNKRPALMGE